MSFIDVLSYKIIEMLAEGNYHVSPQIHADIKKSSFLCDVHWANKR